MPGRANATKLPLPPAELNKASNTTIQLGVRAQQSQKPPAPKK